MLNIILMGPPGAGKGTQAVKLERAFKLPHISTGDMFREEISSGSELGNQVKAIIEKGDLVPDELTVAIVKARLSKDDCAAGYILDGFPRTIPQAEALEKMGEEIGRKVGLVINISAPDEELVRRIGGRRVCPKCGASYNVVSMKPRKEGICDRCGSPLIQRKDDNEASFKVRLANYYKSTAPLLSFYKGKGLLHDFDGMVGSDKLFEELRTLLNVSE
ncbi:MAG: adenylate kinase [Bacilli bacterium]|jgi:adenylate kinase|nr:adenylate kinase [Bacilli bacterium]